MLNIAGVNICLKFDFMTNCNFWIFFLKKIIEVMFGLFLIENNYLYKNKIKVKVGFQIRHRMKMHKQLILLHAVLIMVQAFQQLQQHSKQDHF